MANINKIKLPDGVTYNVQDTVSGYTTNTGTVTGVKVNGTTKSPTSGVVDIGTVSTTDTKNTAGSTDTSSKIYLVGATSQAANPQTYSHDTAYVGTDGCLYSGGNKVLTSAPVTSVNSKTGAVTLTASDVGAITTASKGAANGVAELDANGLVPSSQLPSYVDDVLEYSAKSSFPTTGETGKIYVDTSTNLTYRWSGTAYIEISPSLALGTTSSTAYRGDYGNTAYTHATDANRLTTAKTEGLYKIATTAEGHIKSVTAVAKSDITGLGIPGSDTNTHRPIQVNGTQILGDNTTALNLKAGNNVSVTNSSGTVTIAATDTKYTATTTSIGSASAGTAIAADDITAWSANTPTSCTISQGVLTFTAGSAASLSYTARSIPNISVTSKTVATGITAS